jgi:hypothetical protein
MILLIFWCGFLVALLFAAFSITCALCTLSGWIEENPSHSKSFLILSQFTVFFVHISCILFESKPSKKRLVLSLLANASFFPVCTSSNACKLTDSGCIFGVLLTLVNHCSWFDVFVSNRKLSLIEISSFYTMMVWLVPSLTILYITSIGQQPDLPLHLDYKQLVSKSKIDNTHSDEQVSFLGLFSPAELHARSISTNNNFVK